MTLLMKYVTLHDMHRVAEYRPHRIESLEVVAEIGIIWQFFVHNWPWMTFDDMTVFMKNVTLDEMHPVLQAFCILMHTHDAIAKKVSKQTFDPL